MIMCISVGIQGLGAIVRDKKHNHKHRVAISYVKTVPVTQYQLRRFIREIIASSYVKTVPVS